MHTSKRSSWLLFFSVPVLIGLLVIDSSMIYGVEIHQLVQLGSLVFAFGLVAIGVNGSYGELRADPVETQYPVREHHVYPVPQIQPLLELEEEEPPIAIPVRWLDLVSADKSRYN